MRTLVRDIWDLRQAKLKRGVDLMISQQETFAKVCVYFTPHCSLSS